MVNCLILTPAVNPETQTLPKPLFADCMTILPIAVIEYCNPIGIPMARRFFVTAPFHRQFRCDNFRTSTRFHINTRHKIPLTACAVMVAAAAPAHPKPSTIIQNKSSKIFNPVEIARNTNGVLLSPTALKMLDNRL